MLFLNFLVMADKLYNVVGNDAKINRSRGNVRVRAQEEVQTNFISACVSSCDYDPTFLALNEIRSSRDGFVHYDAKL